MKYYVMKNGQKQFINIDASDVKFKDGDSFQEKLTAGALKGEKGDKGDKGDKGADGANGTNGINGTNGKDGVSPSISITEGTGTHTISITDKTGTKSTVISDGSNGPTGPAGPAGSDATVTRTNIINALGYTPSNSGLTQAEVERMIQENNQNDISIVQLPYKQIKTSGYITPPASNYNGIFTWALQTDASGNITGEDDEGGYENSVKMKWNGSDWGKKKNVLTGLTISSDRSNLGVALGVVPDGLYVKFKGSGSSYLATSTSDKTSASSWIYLCDRFGVLGQANSITCLNCWGNWNFSDWKNWSFKDFPYGLTAGLVEMDNKQWYFALLFKYGSSNKHAHKGYSQYKTDYKGCGIMVLFPLLIYSDAAYNGIWTFTFAANGDKKITNNKTVNFFHWKADASAAR